jgi:hypothetical protein
MIYHKKIEKKKLQFNYKIQPLFRGFSIAKHKVWFRLKLNFIFTIFLFIFLNKIYFQLRKTAENLFNFVLI